MMDIKKVYKPKSKLSYPNIGKSGHFGVFYFKSNLPMLLWITSPAPSAPVKQSHPKNIQRLHKGQKSNQFNNSVSNTCWTL